MPQYRHTQFGWVMLASVAATFVLLAGIAAALPPGEAAPMLVVIPVLALVFLLFINLTVTVDSEVVRLSFGIGLIRKKFPLAEIKSVKPVRNSWWYGWGIRWTPHGWLFNVSGLDAVELELKNGRCYRIGTDQPGQLAGAIQDRLTAG